MISRPYLITMGCLYHFEEEPNQVQVAECDPNDLRPFPIFLAFPFEEVDVVSTIFFLGWL